MQSLHRYLDVLQLREIYSLVETPEGFKGLLDEGLEQASTIIKNIQEALDLNDISRLKSEAHFLKGSMLTLGFRELARLLQVIHHVISHQTDNHLDTVKESASQLLDTYQRTQQELYDSNGVLRQEILDVVILS